MNDRISEVTTFKIEGFKDHRASRFFDISPELAGQISISIVAPEQVSGWHFHKLQTDVFFVASGQLKIAVIDNSGTVNEFLLTGKSALNIPPDHWHCYRSFEQETVLIYHLSRKHDESDEYRCTEGEIEKRFGYKI